MVIKRAVTKDIFLTVAVSFAVPINAIETRISDYNVFSYDYDELSPDIDSVYNGEVGWRLEETESVQNQLIKKLLHLP